MAVGIAPGVTRESQWHMTRTNVAWSEEALAAKAAVDKDDTNPKLWYDLGVILENSGLFRESVDCFSMALIYDPFNADYYMHRGHRYLSIGEVPAFTADFEMCLRIDPKNWWALYYIQEGFQALGHYELAEEYSRRLWEISDENTEYVDAVAVWLCTALARQGKWDEVKKLCETPFLVKMMEAPGPHFGYLQKLELFAGRISPDELYAIVDKMENNGGFSSTGWGLVDYWYAKGEDAKAEALCKRIVARDEGTWQLTGYFLAYYEAKRRGYLADCK